MSQHHALRALAVSRDALVMAREEWAGLPVWPEGWEDVDDALHIAKYEVERALKAMEEVCK